MIALGTQRGTADRTDVRATVGRAERVPEAEWFATDQVLAAAPADDEIAAGPEPMIESLGAGELLAEMRVAAERVSGRDDRGRRR